MLKVSATNRRAGSVVSRSTTRYPTPTRPRAGSIGRRTNSITSCHSRSIPSTPRTPRTSVTLTRDVTTTGATTPRPDRSRSRVEGGSGELHPLSPLPRSRRACRGPLLERSSRGSRSNHLRPRAGHRLEESDRALTGAPRQTDHRTSRIRGRPLGAGHRLRLSSESSSGGRRSRVDRDDVIENFLRRRGVEITKSFSERSRPRRPHSSLSDLQKSKTRAPLSKLEQNAQNLSKMHKSPIRGDL